MNNEVLNEMVTGVTNVRQTKTFLQEDVKLKVLVIGVGNAGNQVVTRAHKANMDVFAINSSIKDLSDQIVDETIQCFIVGKEARGAGKNINKGIELFKSNGKELFSIPAFMNKVQEADIVFVTGSFGGGTGAAIIPEICGILKNIYKERKIIIAYGITPKNCDSTDSMKNTLITVEKIKSLGIPYLLDDLHFYEDEPNDVAFSNIDDHVVESMRAIAGHYLNISSSQMIDENDMKTLVGEPGYMAVYILNKVTNDMLDKATMQSMLIEKIKKSPAMMIQKDGIARHMGVIINCPSDMMETSRTGNYSELTTFLGGRPSGGFFENYSVNNGTTGQFIVILSGMTFPQNRISQYIEIVRRDAENAQRVKHIDITTEVSQLTSILPETDHSRLTTNTAASTEDINNALGSYFS